MRRSSSATSGRWRVDEAQGRLAVAGLADDLVAPALHQRAHDAVAIDGMVVGDDDAQDAGGPRAIGAARHERCRKGSVVLGMAASSGLGLD